MARQLLEDMLHMAWAKKTWKDRVMYVFLTVVFFPFLCVEQRQAGQEGDNEATSQSASGDDVYPLF